MQLEGLQIGRYRFLRMLGSGGMGEVYLAEDARIGQQVAIKVIRAEASPNPDEKATQEATRLFQREAMAIAKLDHPHILPLYDYGEGGLNGTTLTYLVMPFRPEGSLVDWLSRRGSSGLLSLQDVSHIVGQTSEALQHAHDRQIIHQDVKPSNLLIRERKDVPNRPDVLLADFGIAKSATATASTSQVIRGTPTYMAPEQWKGQPESATDQYALAVMTYELLTGRPPFQGGSVQMMYQHFHVQPSPPSTFNTRLPVDVDIVLLHALAKKPNERFASISSFSNAFQLAVQSNEVSNSVITPSPLDSPISFVVPMPNETDSGTGTPIISYGLPIEPQNAPGPTASVQSDEAETSESTAVPAIKLIPGKTPTDVLSAQRTGEVVDASNATGGTGVINSGLSTGSNPPTSVNEGGQRHRKGRRLLAVALITLAVLLICTSIVYAALGGFSSLFGRAFGTPSAIVTITPMRKDLKNTYLISAVTGTIDPTQHEVQSRQISLTTSPQSQVANATGARQVSGTQATGRLIFETAGPSTTIPAGTVYTGKSGVQVATDKDVNILDGNHVWPVSAHAVKPGANGNIPASDIQQDIGSKFYVYNDAPFTGGQDPQNYTVVQQSDIDGVAKSLESQYAPDPQKVLQGKVQANERFIGTPQCTPNMTSNHGAGEAATSVIVTVSFTCTGEVYDQQGALAMAKQWLIQDASKNPGVGYTLVGNVVIIQAQAPTLNNNQTLSVPITTEGVWVFQINNANEQALAKLIAGKKRETAQSLLSHQPGIAQDQVQLMGGDSDTLPSDTKQIKFVILDVIGK